jgi:hypothetical protein
VRIASPRFAPDHDMLVACLESALKARRRARSLFGSIVNCVRRKEEGLRHVVGRFGSPRPLQALDLYQDPGAGVLEAEPAAVDVRISCCRARHPNPLGVFRDSISHSMNPAIDSLWNACRVVAKVQPETARGRAMCRATVLPVAVGAASISP